MIGVGWGFDIFGKPEMLAMHHHEDISLFSKLLIAVFSIMLILFGSVVFNAMLYAFILSPLVFAGSWGGLKAGDRISKQKLSVYMEFLLFIIAVTSILKPFI